MDYGEIVVGQEVSNRHDRSFDLFGSTLSLTHSLNHFPPLPPDEDEEGV
jgi:hypothetical protein